jgi:hypothetical protein
MKTVTMLLYCNADGSEKLRPLVVGKLLHERRAVPCDYKASKNA